LTAVIGSVAVFSMTVSCALRPQPYECWQTSNAGSLKMFVKQ